MQTYIAHYRSPAASDARATGLFEFQSDARAGTKANSRDARLRMLELYGKDAVSWTIDKVERKRSREAVSDGQLELDFRAPKPVRKRAKKKEYW
jgi:nicotinic acid mononucleotide adenylyltransferase